MVLDIPGRQALGVRRWRCRAVFLSVLSDGLGKIGGPATVCMRDTPLIIGGLAVFLAVLSLPAWYDRAHGAVTARPALAPPAGGKSCVAPVEFMRRSHMTLLVEWRESVVRTGDRSFVAYDGHRYAKSLTGTCLGCHGRKAEFCDRCHQYEAVSPNCWNCHLEQASGIGVQDSGADHGR